MARFGRTSPPSTRLRAPVRPDGPPPHVYELAVAGEQTTARPVNRAIGEVRVAPEQTTARAVGRAHARTPGVPVEQDTARAFAGRTHRRDLGRAGETTTAVAARRAHRRGVARSFEYSSARSILGDRPSVSPAAWAAAIESEDRTPIMALRADWARYGDFDHPLSELTDLTRSVTVDRSLATNLPANVGIVEGSTAASLSADLGGAWRDVDFDFSNDPVRVTIVGLANGPAGSAAVPPNGTATATSPTFTPVAGEIIVVKVSAIGPTSVVVRGGGLTWVTQVLHLTSPYNNAPNGIWTAQVTSPAEMSVSVDFTSTNTYAGVGSFTAERWSNVTLADAPVVMAVPPSFDARRPAPYIAPITTTVPKSVVTWHG